MTGVALNYKIDFSDPIRALEQLRGADRRLLAAEIGDYVVSETLLNFENQQTPEGESWEPSLRAQEEGGKTLQDFGHLRDSYTYAVALNGDSVEIGSNMIYAAIHHFGGEAGRNKAVTLPARTALGLTPEMETEIELMTIDFFNETLQ
jgi:phage virion morphogenesis protein